MTNLNLDLNVIFINVSVEQEAIDTVDFNALMPQVRARVNRFETATEADVYITKPDRDGCEHHIISLKKNGNPLFTIGAIKRKDDKEYSFHS